MNRQGQETLIHKSIVFHMLKKDLSHHQEHPHQGACVLPFPCQIFVPGWKTFDDIYLMVHTCWVDETPTAPEDDLLQGHSTLLRTLAGCP